MSHTILLCRMWPTLVFLILQKIVFWFWRKSFYDFFAIFPDFEENRFLIYKKIVSVFFTILFRFWRKSFFDFGENRFLIFSWFLETRFIKLICIRKNTEKIVCKSRDFNTILSTIYSTIFLVWEVYIWRLDTGCGPTLYIGSVTATTHQEKGIMTLESNPSRELYY